MKKLITLLSLLTLSTMALATPVNSSRTEGLVSGDAYDRLQKIAEVKTELEKKEVALSNLEKELVKATAAAKTHNQSKIIIGVGLVGGAAVALNFYSPLSQAKPLTDVIGKILTTMVGGSVFSVVTVYGVVSYALSSNDAKELGEKTRLAKTAVQDTQKLLTKEIIQLCKSDSRNALCY